MPWRERARHAALYLATGLLCLLILVLHLRLPGVSLRTPFRYYDDAVVSFVWVQNVLEDGWYDHSRRAGAPYGMDLRDFPAAEAVHFALLKPLGLGSRNVFRVVNAWYLSTNPLASLTAVFAFRRLGFHALPSLIGGLVFAFLPFHFWRGESHLLLSGYFLVPLSLLIAIWVSQGRLVGWQRWMLAVLVAAISSSGGIYYAFFDSFFLLLGALGACLYLSRFRPLLPGLAQVGVLLVGLLGNLLPRLLYTRAEGVNRTVAQRAPDEADRFGLNLTQMVLPRSGHGLSAVSEWKARYTDYPGRPLPNDFGSSLGTVGTVGLALVLAVALFGRRPEEPSIFHSLGGLAVGGILLGTIGGLGSVFAFVVSPQIRAYDRISIFLGFLALAGVVWLLDRALARARGWRTWSAGVVGCVGVLLFGLWDQTSPADVPDYAALRSCCATDAAFASAVEQALPPEAMVFQLPVCSFPEGSIVHRCSGYDHCRLLLHSRKLRFSHGTVRGRYGAWVLDQLAGLPPELLLPRIVGMGYSGLHIDRNGYPDKGRELDAKVRQLLGTEPIVSGNGRDLFFSLTAYASSLRQQHTPEQWARQQQDLCYPPRGEYGEGFLGWLRQGGHSWQWGGPEAELVFFNPRTEPKSIKIHFVLMRPRAEPATFHLSGLCQEVVEFQGVAINVDRVVLLPPGRHTLRLRCDGPPPDRWAAAPRVRGRQSRGHVRAVRRPVSNRLARRTRDPSLARRAYDQLRSPEE
jgi:phosphoglycerol transferase